MGVRLASLRHGLPFSYNADEELHFVPHAAAAADGSLDPRYFDNPSGLTYVLALVLRAAFPTDDVTDRLASDPTAVFTVARAVVAVLGAMLVPLVHRAGQRYAGRAVGLVAAGMVAFAFVPVFYSHQALNDVPTLLPLTVALIASLGVWERGDLRSYLLAGAAVGVAAAFKYNAAPMALTVALAAGLRTVRRRDRPLAVARLLGISAVAAVVGLLLLNPYLVLDLGTAASQLGGQSAQAGAAKLGQSGSAWTGYPQSLWWGLGAAPTGFAVVGAVLMLRRDLPKALLLLTFPVVLYLYLSTQERYFARWLLPCYPMLAVLAGYGLCETGRWVHGRLAAVRVPALLAALVLPAFAVATVAPSVRASVRSDRVLGHVDTRTEARDWILAHLGGRGRIVVEPAVPADYLPPSTGVTTYPVAPPFQSYETTLRPGLLDTYRRAGYCWVMVDSHQHDRGIAAGLPGARAYYDRLARETRSLVVFSPYRPGSAPPAFSFDFSFDWYPTAYERPGPYVEIRRLTDCPAPRINP